MVNFELLDKHIQGLIKQGCFPSATLAVFHHNELIKETAYGTPDPEHPWPARVDTRYDVASLSKLFAGTAFLKLCVQGVFDLDDPVSKSFPLFTGDREIRLSANALLQDQPDEVIGHADAGKVTWRHILVHNSGIGWAPLHLRCRDREDAIRYICTMPFAYQTGETVLYTDLVVSRLQSRKKKKAVRAVGPQLTPGWGPTEGVAEGGAPLRGRLEGGGEGGTSRGGPRWGRRGSPTGQSPWVAGGGMDGEGRAEALRSSWGSQTKGSF